MVKGYPRIGIFAIRDIADGEALSYDYQFDTNEAETFKCYCGADKCRGTMAPKKKGSKGLLDAQGRPQNKEERERLILMVSDNLSEAPAFGAFAAFSLPFLFMPIKTTVKHQLLLLSALA